MSLLLSMLGIAGKGCNRRAAKPLAWLKSICQNFQKEIVTVIIILSRMQFQFKWLSCIWKRLLLTNLPERRKEEKTHSHRKEEGREGGFKEQTTKLGDNDMY
ncbi:hypothetical protein Y1Q_0010738 [Alligator mississippiensis]|uniref:Uncharacterized protein n=1 Tax=Alligator mississippiensis TaxID=8496 RepID=A0A151M6S7_ALLMI|nr:hypothetical protein Y1Q_0010738 [Alligator mississippiensis]